MANYEATRYDFDGANLLDVEGVNTGIIIPWTSVSIPSGFLECAGAAVSRTTYSALFTIVGTTYGVGDGASTFNVPDLTDSVVVTTSPTKALASTGGANTVASTGNIGGTLANATVSTPELPSHTHGVTFGAQISGIQNASGMGQSAARNPTTTFTSPPVGGGGAHTHPVSATLTGVANSVLQPYLTLIYVIKT
tara:strand:+ start:1231 stop:1812 length:582 start_codon:yes stop_codon:yes gene_type:complete